MRELTQQMVVFFKQKTAYELRARDWSSDVCSSDLSRRLSLPCPNLLCGFNRTPTRLQNARCPPRFHFVRQTALSFFHLAEFELHGSRAAENRDRHAQAALLVVDVLHRSLEVGERAVLHAHHLADLEQHLALGLLHALAHLLHDRVDFLLGNRRRLGRRAADETGHLVGVLDEVPGVVVHLHLDQHVPREELALGHVLLPALHLDDFLDRHQDLAELVLHSRAVDAVLQCALHRLLEAGISVHHVPTLISRRRVHVFFHPRSRSYSTHSSVLSLIHRNTAITSTNANTAAVACIVSLRVGQTTFFTSAQDSSANVRNCLPGADSHATAAPARSPATTASSRSTSAVSASQ